MTRLAREVTPVVDPNDTTNFAKKSKFLGLGTITAEPFRSSKEVQSKIAREM